MPAAQITALGVVKAAANALAAKLALHNAATPPTQVPSNSPEAQAAVAAIVTYGTTYNADDLDILADPATPLRAHAGYAWLQAHGLAIDLETRILAQSTSFPRPRVQAILDGIVKWSTVPGFEAKVNTAVVQNRFWSPNDGFFFEITAFGSVADLNFCDVLIGANTIDALTGSGILIDTKFEICLDPASLVPPRTPDLKTGMKRQMAAMSGAVGTGINGITITDWQFRYANPLDAATQAHLVSLGIASHFIPG